MVFMKTEDGCMTMIERCIYLCLYILRRREDGRTGRWYGLCSHSRFLFDEKERGRLGSCYVFGE